MRLAVEKAKQANVPKDNIERAIKRGAGANSDGRNFEEVTYEILGPGGSALVVEAVTDNKNRTVSELKTILNKNQGQLGGPNSVLWQFKRQGEIVVDKKALAGKNPEELELALIDAGAQEIKTDDHGWQIYTEPDKVQAVTNALKNQQIETKESALIFLPKEELKIIDPEQQNKIEVLFGLLEGLPDVNNVYTNADW